MIMPDISKTKSDIFESTPKVKRERNLHFNIPCGLSPPDFSALKISKLKEDEDEIIEERPIQNLEVIFADVPQILMSPFLDLGAPHRFSFEDKNSKT